MSAPASRLLPLPHLLACVIDAVAREWDGCLSDAPGGEIDVGAALRTSFPARWSALAEAQLASDRDASVRPLRDGEIMGAYMDFDRTADKAWTSSEYLVQFGLHISRLTTVAATAALDAHRADWAARSAAADKAMQEAAADLAGCSRKPEDAADPIRRLSDARMALMGRR